MVSVDVQGIQEIRDEFELLPREMERAMRVAVRRTVRAADTQVRNVLRKESGLSVEGSKIRVRSGQRSRRRGEVWGGANHVLVDFLRGAVKEQVDSEGRTQYYVYGKHLPGAFRGRSGPINGRGYLRERTQGGRRSRFVRVPIDEAVRIAFDAGARHADEVLVANFQREVDKIVRRTRV